jgi:hypothetical protein
MGVYLLVIANSWEHAERKVPPDYDSAILEVALRADDAALVPRLETISGYEV